MRRPLKERMLDAVDRIEHSAAIGQVNRLAEDCGRLRRRVEPESSLYYLWERMANVADVLDAMLRPTAGALCSDGWTVEAALEQVEHERASLRSRCGG